MNVSFPVFMSTGVSLFESRVKIRDKTFSLHFCRRIGAKREVLDVHCDRSKIQKIIKQMFKNYNKIYLQCSPVWQASDYLPVAIFYSLIFTPRRLLILWNHLQHFEYTQLRAHFSIGWWTQPIKIRFLGKPIDDPETVKKKKWTNE